jgi:hypothetical protein
LAIRPLDLAVESGNLDIVKLLLDAGAGDSDDFKNWVEGLKKILADDLSLQQHCKETHTKSLSVGYQHIQKIVSLLEEAINQ